MVKDDRLPNIKNVAMNLELKDKVIVVTGGDKGIGNGICNVLANEGAIPVIIGRNEEDVQSAVKAIENKGQKVAYAIAELTDVEQCKNAIQKIVLKPS